VNFQKIIFISNNELLAASNIFELLYFPDEEAFDNKRLKIPQQTSTLNIASRHFSTGRPSKQLHHLVNYMVDISKDPAK